MSCGAPAFTGPGRAEAGTAVFFGRGFGRATVRFSFGAAGGVAARAAVRTDDVFVAEVSRPLGRGADDGVRFVVDVGAVATTGGSGSGVAALSVDGCSRAVEVGVVVFPVVFGVRSE